MISKISIFANVLCKIHNFSKSFDNLHEFSENFWPKISGIKTSEIIEKDPSLFKSFSKFNFDLNRKVLFWGNEVEIFKIYYKFPKVQDNMFSPKHWMIWESWDLERSLIILIDIYNIYHIVSTSIKLRKTLEQFCSNSIRKATRFCYICLKLLISLRFMKLGKFSNRLLSTNYYQIH